MDVVTIVALDNASQRTRNRIVEHGPSFTELKRGTCNALRGEVSVLVDSNMTLWCGWLPLNEIEIIRDDQWMSI